MTALPTVYKGRTCSDDEFDPGYANFMKLRQDYVIKVLLDGVEQKHVDLADTEMGFVRRTKLDADGELQIVYATLGERCHYERRLDGKLDWRIEGAPDENDRSFVLIECVKGEVEIVLEPLKDDVSADNYSCKHTIGPQFMRF